jgi:uncharacterized damage-inducible protein DinB
MENSNQLASRFREVLLDGKWIANTNYKDQLSSINWKQATKKIGSLNTIAALTFHINYYLDGILNVFRVNILDIRDKYSFDMPPVKSKEDWETLLSELVANAEKVANFIDQMSEKRLEENFVDEKYGTYRRNIEAVIEHGYYHLGQISLIKKMIMELESKK